MSKKSNKRSPFEVGGICLISIECVFVNRHKMGYLAPGEKYKVYEITRADIVNSVLEFCKDKNLIPYFIHYDGIVEYNDTISFRPSNKLNNKKIWSEVMSELILRKCQLHFTNNVYFIDSSSVSSFNILKKLLQIRGLTVYSLVDGFKAKDIPKVLSYYKDK